MADVGYKRVSSVGQKTDRQLDGVKLDKVFEDKESGRDIDRPGLSELLGYIREDDIVHVHSMDRLSRKLTDLEELVRDLTNEGVSVRFHKENLFFKAGGNIDPINTLMFQVLASVAQFERAIIRERQLEGIAKAKERGVYKGRKPTIDKEPILQAYKQGAKKSEIVKEFGISRGYLYKVLGNAGLK